MVFDEDEQYELISKEKLIQMKTELEKLKKKKLETTQEKKEFQKTSQDKLTSKNSNLEIQSNINSTIDNAINSSSQDSFIKENKKILSQINELKEFNKQTLNNIIDKYENLEHNIELISDHLTQIVKYLKINKDKLDTVNENIDSIKDNTQNLDTKQIIKKIDNLDDYKSKLNYIENFMNKLSILLSQLKVNNSNLEYKPEPKFSNNINNNINNNSNNNGNLINNNNTNNNQTFPSNPLSNQQNFK